MAKQKVSRKKLLKEPDEFITFSGRLIQFGRQHGMLLGGLFGALIAALMVFSGIRYFSAKAENKAFYRLSTAQVKYSELLQKGAPADAYQGVKPDFEALLKTFGGKAAGKLARVAFAHLSFEGGAPQAAVELYTQALPDFEADAAVTTAILSGRAYAREALGDYAGAASDFEALLAQPAPLMKDEALFQLGRLYRQIGKPEKSLEAYAQIVSEYPDSLFAEAAREKKRG